MARFTKKPPLSSHVAHRSASPPAVVRVPAAPRPGQPVVSSGASWCLGAVMCGSLTTDAAEHLLTRLAAVCAWSLVASAWFSVGLFVHMWSFERSFYTLEQVLSPDP